jgi:hypothetical protein
LFDFSLYTITPVEHSNGMALQGEVNKLVGVSHARFRDIYASAADGLSVEVFGSEGEMVEIGFIYQDGTSHVVTCVFEGDNVKNQRSGTGAIRNKGFLNDLGGEVLSLVVTSSGLCV